MKNLITDLYTPAEINQMAQGLNGVIGIAAGKGVGLDPKTRQGRRKMGTARQGYVNLILPVAINNIGELPRDKDPQQLSDLMSAFYGIATVRGLALKMFEWADDTMMALGMDAVALTDSLAASLQTARSDNDSLDAEMGEIDDYNSRFGKQMDDEDKKPGDAGAAQA